MTPRRWTLIIRGGVFLLALDQALKYFAFAHQASTRYIIEPWLGWEYFANPGIAFSLPIPNAFLITVTPFILLVILLLLVRQKRPLPALGLILITAGAISNFIDRILYGVTIDYLRIAASVFNLGDVLIVAGAVLFVAKTRHHTQQRTYIDNQPRG